MNEIKEFYAETKEDFIWFCKEVCEMFSDVKAFIRRYKASDKKKQKAVRRKTAWFLAYVLVHAIIIAIGLVMGMVVFFLAWCTSKYTPISEELAIMVLCISSFSIIVYGIKRLGWESILKASKRRDIRLDVARYRKRAYMETK